MTHTAGRLRHLRTQMAATMVIALTAGVVFTTAPVVAVAPQPVVPIDLTEPGDEPDTPDGDGESGDDGEAVPAEEPADQWVPPEHDCLNVPMASGGLTLLGTAGLSSPRTSYPGPVVAVPDQPRPWPTNCSADISMLLVIDAPDGRKPENVDALMEDLAIPQASLESFFEVRVPAQTRVISIVEPQDEWELKSVRCDCIGTQQSASARPPRLLLTGIGAGARTSQPQPVVPVEASGVTPGGCVGISSSAALRDRGPITLSSVGAPGDAAYRPQPVIPVDPGPQPWSPPPRQPALVSWDEQGNVRMYDPDGAGGSFHCVWTVELVKGRFSVTTVTIPDGEEDRFQYQLTPALLHPRAQPFQMQANPTATSDLRRGAWTAWLRDIPEGWTVKQSTCTESETELVTVADGPQARLGIDPGDDVACTFELKLLAPRAGRWESENKPGTIRCTLRTLNQRLSGGTDSGRLSVEDDGDKLVGRGGPGTGKFTVRRDRDNPFVYRGKLDIGVGAATVTTNVRVRLVSERRMTGTLKASFRQGGVRCTIQRRFVLTRAGGN